MMEMGSFMLIIGKSIRLLSLQGVIGRKIDCFVLFVCFSFMILYFKLDLIYIKLNNITDARRSDLPREILNSSACKLRQSPNSEKNQIIPIVTPSHIRHSRWDPSPKRTSYRQRSIMDSDSAINPRNKNISNSTSIITG